MSRAPALPWRSRRTALTALSISLVTGLTRLAAMAREVALAALLGTSPWRDALVLAGTIPSLGAALWTETLQPVLLPALARGLRNDEGRRLRGLFGALWLFQAGFVMLLWWRPGLALEWLCGNRLAVSVQADAAPLLRFLAPNALLLLLQFALAARAQARARFWAPALAPLCGALGALAGAAVGFHRAPGAAAAAVAIGTTAGNAVAVLLLGAASGGTLPRRRDERHQPAGWAFGGGLLCQLLAATAILSLMPVVERRAALQLGPGALAGFEYGQRIVQWIFTLSVAPIATVGFTRLALAGPGEFERFLHAGLLMLLWVTSAVAIGAVLLAPAMVHLILAHGHFGAQSSALTAPVVRILGGGLPLDALVFYLLAALYARGEARWRLPSAILMTGTFAPAALWLTPRLGLAGLAWAHLAAWAAVLPWIWRRLQRGASRAREQHGQAPPLWPPPPLLSAVVIAHNEAERIEDCLASLQDLAEEIVVVDDFSTDDTVAIARRHGARILQRRFDWAARQMNHGIAAARGRWILIIDADERLSAELREEIRHAIWRASSADGFYCPRRNLIFGRWLRHGGNYPDYNSMRLFRRGRGWFEEEPIHARLRLDGRPGYLRGDLIHLSYRDLHHYLEKFNAYTSLEAERMRRAGRRFSWRRLAAQAGGHLFIRLIVRSAWRDGWPGCQYAFLGFAYDCVRHLKLREAERGPHGSRAFEEEIHAHWA